MIDSATKKNIVKNFEIAAEEFDFCFVSPYCIGENDEYSFFGYLFRDNLEKGVVIDILSDVDERDEEKWNYCVEHHIFYSCLYAEVLLGEYDRRYFGEMLKDWKYEF